MKLWIGGEVESEVAESFRKARANVERAINIVIEGKTYSDRLKGWDCIAILRDDEAFAEITDYSPRTREMDYRLKIDHSKFKKSDRFGRERMIFEMLWRSLIILSESSVLKEEIKTLMLDVRTIGNENHWVDA